MTQTTWTLKMSVAALLCAISYSSFAQGVPGFSKGTDYRLVRKSLIEANWMPVTQPMPPEYDQRTRGIRQMGYPEVDSCSPTGMGYCLFVFQHKETRKKLDIITTGEGPGQSLKFSHYRI